MKLIGNIKEKCSRTYKRYCNFPPQGSVFVESDRTFPFFQGLGFGKKISSEYAISNHKAFIQRLEFLHLQCVS